jgi:hypothetical protein
MVCKRGIARRLGISEYGLVEDCDDSNQEDA